MSYKDSIEWLKSLKQQIGQAQHRDLWHFEQAIDEIIDNLKPLARSHGRLIDADKAATSILMMNNHPCGNSIETVNDVVEWLRFADENGNNIAFPTIIEAEVSE